MLNYDYDESVGYWLATATHAVRRALESELCREQITIRQWEVLNWLAMEGDLTQAELAERMCVEPPTLTGILARMERDGWLERRGCTADRRCKRLAPTDRAEAVWSRMAACGHRVRKHATQGLSDGDLQTLKSICARIRQNLATNALDSEQAAAGIDVR